MHKWLRMLVSPIWLALPVCSVWYPKYECSFYMVVYFRASDKHFWLFFSMFFWNIFFLLLFILPFCLVAKRVGWIDAGEADERSVDRIPPINHSTPTGSRDSCCAKCRIFSVRTIALIVTRLHVAPWCSKEPWSTTPARNLDSDR